jgi:hypothetical protein
MIITVDIRYITSSKGARPMTDTKADYKFNPPAPSKVVTLAIEARDKMLAEARIEVLKEAARAVCWMCQENYTLFLSKWVYKHAVTGELNAIDCHANAIHQLLATAEQGQD